MYRRIIASSQNCISVSPFTIVMPARHRYSSEAADGRVEAAIIWGKQQEWGDGTSLFGKANT
jgi:hypothetical protein